VVPEQPRFALHPQDIRKVGSRGIIGCVEEEYRLRSHNSALWGSIYSQWLQHELALTGRYATKDAAMISLAVNSPGAIEWWDRAGASVYPDEFCAYVVKRLPEVADTLPDKSIY
jgi:hypothetical protein